MQFLAWFYIVLMSPSPGTVWAQFRRLTCAAPSKQFGYGHSLWENDLTLGTGGVLYHLPSEPENSCWLELFSNTQQAKLTWGRTSQ